MRMHIDRRGLRYACRDARNSDQYPCGSVRQSLGDLNLVEIAGGIIIDRRPEQIAQVSHAGPARRLPGPRLEIRNLCSNLVRKVGMEPALKHLSTSEIL